MEEGLLDLLVNEVIAQGHRAWISSKGTRVFAVGENLIICPNVPASSAEWQRLLRDLTQSGLLWPPRKRG